MLIQAAQYGPRCSVSRPTHRPFELPGGCQLRRPGCPGRRLLCSLALLLRSLFRRLLLSRSRPLSRLGLCGLQFCHALVKHGADLRQWVGVGSEFVSNSGSHNSSIDSSTNASSGSNSSSTQAHNRVPTPSQLSLPLCPFQLGSCVSRGACGEAQPAPRRPPLRTALLWQQETLHRAARQVHSRARKTTPQ